jgi:hypothetical protein
MNAVNWQAIFILGVLMFSGCDNKAHWKKSEHPIVQHNKVTAPVKPANEKVKKATLSIPKTLHEIAGTLIYTSYIGTPDHPTIDGGILNSTEGVPVNQDTPIKNTLPQQKIVKAILVHSKEDCQIPFNDDWATSKRVKQLLIAASSHGKLEYVLKKTDQMGLPASVAVIPMVESNYETKAVSPKGAAGAWQLMPSTAKSYGINNQDRFQFALSTDTALQLLNDLYQQFGNWELAFAAYNAGSKRVLNAIQKNPKAKTIEELDLPQETKNYVKRILVLTKTMMELSVDV